jgi:ABC-type nitrate/sulfonate/bicarbonate transport system permease component
VANRYLSRIGLSKERLLSMAAALTLVLAWGVLSHIAPAYAVPRWSKILEALIHIPIQDVAISIVRILVSLLLSFVIGITCSLLMFERPNREAFFLPLVKLVMAVPAVCWVVFAILWFEGVELRIYFVMLITCAPVFMIDSLDAMKSFPSDLKQMARSFRPTGLQVLRTIIIPGILPNILTSWKINLTLAVRVVTIAELVGAVNGIGHGLVLAQEMFSVAEVFAWTVILVAILYVLQGVVNFAERHLLQWRSVEA